MTVENSYQQCVPISGWQEAGLHPHQRERHPELMASTQASLM